VLTSLALCLGLSFSAGEALALDLSPADAAWEIQGLQYYEQLGFKVSWAGDLNGDGLGDLLVSAPGRQTEGYVLALRNDGQLLWRLEASETSYAFGSAITPVGDWTGDGIMDFALGDSQDVRAGINAGWVGVYSGADASLIWESTCDGEELSRCGAALSGNCDVNGDGVGDLLIGISAASDRGKIMVVSGADQSISHQIMGPGLLGSFGSAVSCLGDWNADGRDDLLVGAPRIQNQSGEVFIYSGLTGELLQSIRGGAGDQLGASVSFVGNVSGDGMESILLGAPQDAQRPGYAQVVHATSGFSYRFVGEDKGRNFGSAVGYLGDFNLDGYFDLLIGDPSYDNALGRVYVYSGKTGELLVRYTGDADSWANNFGFAVFSAGDLTGNEVPDLIVGSPYSGDAQQYQGKAYVFHSPFVAPGVPPAPEPETPPPVEEPPVVVEPPVIEEPPVVVEPPPVEEELSCRPNEIRKALKSLGAKPSFPKLGQLIRAIANQIECKKSKAESKSKLPVKSSRLKKR
jgi:hypothetical protein